MRITISIADDLHRAAVRLARERGETLSAVIEAALRRELAVSTQHVVPNGAGDG